MFEGFTAQTIETGDTTIFLQAGGSGPPLLLLHGFPETYLMWRDVAPILARYFSIVCADLRGYGQSGCPVSTADHAPYAKRAMAADMVAVMRQLDFDHFAVAGHDRGGRVAYRLALDHPGHVTACAVLDIVPTAAAWDRADARFAQAFWPWSLLAQPAPLPERLIGAAAEAVVDDALSQWGTRPDVFPAAVRDAYVDALRDPAHVHAICEEYRAAATLDRDHDAEGGRITCPLLALWSAQGALSHWYEEEGGPLALWQSYADQVTGTAIDGGHFFPEENPQATAAALEKFFLAAK